MAASENALGSLHVLVAQVLKARLGDKELCTAADVNAAIKFLKDNNITCAPDEGNHLDDLTQELQKASDANKVSPADDADLRAALESASFATSVAH